jgi:uncharacterized protein (DUF488 family)
MTQKPITLYTIGHSNMGLDEFTDLLKTFGVEQVVDCRSVPYSRFVPHFNKTRLDKSLSQHGIGYVFTGEKLGGRPKDESCSVTSPDGLSRVEYRLIQEKDWFKEGIEEVKTLAEGKVIALLCSEEDPARCHRHHLLTKTLLADERIKILHIRRKGGLQSPDDIPEPFI